MHHHQDRQAFFPHWLRETSLQSIISGGYILHVEGPDKCSQGDQFSLLTELTLLHVKRAISLFKVLKGVSLVVSPFCSLVLHVALVRNQFL